VFRNLSIALFLFAPAFTACAQSPVVDELAGESAADDVTSAKADSDALATFFTVTRDTRRCAAPMCGGYYVERVNHAKTHCPGIGDREQCYVADVDASALGLAGRELEGFQSSLGNTIVLRGDLANVTIAGHRVARFTATEAWQAGIDGAEPDGVWVELNINSVRCIDRPCNSITERKLNSTLSADIADLDWSASGATDDEMAKAQEALAAGTLIIAGDRTYLTEHGRTAKARTVTQFFTKMQPSQSACVVTGCSNELCADEARVSSCIWKDEYACYQGATCERQADGACGWTATEELDSCLAQYN
jgi:hypothetical protein